MHDSVFTKMLHGELSAPMIYSDDHTFAILDQNPVSRGHALVITKQQIDQLEDCSDELYAAVFKAVRVVAQHLRKELKPKRIALVVHGFDVPHVHVHVVPMYTGKELYLADRPEGLAADQGSIMKLANQLQMKADA